MAVENVRRGEIYSVRMDNGVGSEQGVYRPGLVISNNRGNNESPLVVVAYLTTRAHDIGIHYGPTKATGKQSYVQCEQLYTVSKDRLQRRMGILDEKGMREVERRLEEVLDLGYKDDSELKEKEVEVQALNLQISELQEEISGMKAKSSDIYARDAEIAMWKGLYEKALNMVVEMKFASDVTSRFDEPKKDVSTPVESVEVEPKLVDINTAKFSVLRGIGLSKDTILNVINNRPYKKIEDLKKVPGVTDIMYNLVKNKICCVPVPDEEPKSVVDEVKQPEKLNINTANKDDFVNMGLGRVSAEAIIAYRRKNGLFQSVDDLLKVKRFGNFSMRIFRDRLEV